eukprot:GABU01009225.1.p3 GENE.GABU01009225.1~~GABU01009225.1.p3  ORF type:complete len:116 (+),score=7.24 GABU01009225.1:401-748(+)
MPVFKANSGSRSGRISKLRNCIKPTSVLIHPNSASAPSACISGASQTVSNPTVWDFSLYHGKVGSWKGFEANYEADDSTFLILGRLEVFQCLQRQILLRDYGVSIIICICMLRTF